MTLFSCGPLTLTEGLYLQKLSGTAEHNSFFANVALLIAHLEQATSSTKDTTEGFALPLMNASETASLQEFIWSKNWSVSITQKKTTAGDPRGIFLPVNYILVVVQK